MMEPLQQFRDAIQVTGLEPPDIIVPGKMHRFPGIGKRKANRAGWCRLFEDGLGGCFGDWSSGFSLTWQMKRDKPFLPIERDAFRRRVAEAQAQAEAERVATWDAAAIRASRIWQAASPCPANHPYLIQKFVRPVGARLHGRALVVPVLDFAGTLTSLQFIGPDGSKRLLVGGRKHGCFIPVSGDSSRFSRVIICEGWATGCTLAGDEPASLVLAAIDAGNLEPVAVSARQHWPSAELVIAGDDDRQTPGNPGATKARAAAIASNALLALPQWPAGSPNTLSDFNDLATWLTGGAS